MIRSDAQPASERPEQAVRLTLASVPDFAVPQSVRLRRLLKVALRSFGFRCTLVKDISVKGDGVTGRGS
jgi:hypothetical protein